jgi:agmatine deiminase
MSNYRQPAEWEKHSACWLAWPSHAELWQEDLEKAQAEFTALAHAICDWDPATRQALGERLEVLVPDERAQLAAERALGHLPVRFHRIPFGDIWLRDTAPIFVRDEKGSLAAASFAFNGWGGKYVLPHDSEVSARVAKASGVRTITHGLVMEGGSLEVDGEGTLLTSEQCLLNPNRNPGMDRAAIEKELMLSLGVSKILWVKDGLLNDHTDGHIDTIARYVAPGVVACMEPAPTGVEGVDTNTEVLLQIARDLEAMTDAKGRKLKVVKIPSPGHVYNDEDDLMPASYLNFYIGNRTVVVPTYGERSDEAAVEAIAKIFPDRRTVGLSARAILTGGGAFHCITQQQPVEGSKT